MVRGGRDCGDNRYDLRRCEAAAFSVSTDSETYVLKHTVVFLFGSERTAERHVDDFESHLEKVHDSVSSLEYEVIHDGEFIEVKASIDWDDLGDCYLLETLLGNECLVRAKANPPAPDVVAEGPPTIQVNSMGDYVGKEVVVRGYVVSYQYEPIKAGQGYEYQAYLLEIEDLEDPYIINWAYLKRVPESHVSRLRGNIVCIRGAVFESEQTFGSGSSYQYDYVVHSVFATQELC
jgi:hypothetical protein